MKFNIIFSENQFIFRKQKINMKKNTHVVRMKQTLQKAYMIFVIKKHNLTKMIKVRITILKINQTLKINQKSKREKKKMMLKQMKTILK